MKFKTFTAFSAKGLDKQINMFIEREEVTVLKIHFSSSFNGLSVLIEYEEK
jgi:hypothetical protein